MRLALYQPDIPQNTGAILRLAACFGLAVNPTTSDFKVAVNGPGGNGFVDSTNTLDTASGALAAVNTPGAFECLAGFWIYLSSAQSGGTYTGIYVVNSVSPGNLPVSWQSVTNHVREYLRTSSTLATDPLGPRMLIAMCGTTVGTDTNKLLVTSGTTIPTDITPSFMSGTTKIVTGITYSETDNLWGILAQDGSNTYLYTTASPQTTTSWILVHTFAGTTGSGGLSSVGGVWAASLEISTGRRIVYSGDVASAGASCTWQTSNAQLSQAGTHLYRGQGALLSFGSTAYAFSRQVGFGPQGLY